ncbi:hypothetical protein [Nesterenkonia lutea]|uniref:Uncharacterized protein n=1 Tax=Nesterenkonia lutea TaxID=272919 RepID=A0ABR9JGS3_9MICC|nr:hypothetical protein [Nesterenkonia lutea]MBE1525130.1 hypothetical protein [Nesterenkonia lutea]
MHVSVLCRSELFKAQIGGGPCDPRMILPDWDRHDRLGVVMSSPLGAVGASLMIQLAMGLSYDAEPRRREDQYPPVFLFHVGGRFGDFSPMDVWPPRREVFVPADPYVLLGALNDRGITRLLLPETGLADTGLPESGLQGVGEAPEGPAASPAPWRGRDWICRSPSGWTDGSSFCEQLASAYLYAPRGGTAVGETVLSSSDPECEAMVEDVLQPHRCHQKFARREDAALLEIGAGPSSVSDLRQWLEIFGTRLDEVDPATRAQMLACRRACREAGITAQTYRRLSADEALARFSTGKDPAENL